MMMICMSSHSVLLLSLSICCFLCSVLFCSGLFISPSCDDVVVCSLFVFILSVRPFFSCSFSSCRLYLWLMYYSIFSMVGCRIIIMLLLYNRIQLLGMRWRSENSSSSSSSTYYNNISIRYYFVS